VIWKPLNYNWDCEYAKSFSESAEDLRTKTCAASGNVFFEEGEFI